MKICKTDKILLIAPHPDDEVIACGGFLAKYSKQIDVLCVNSSGVKYSGNDLSAEEIAEIRCQEFNLVMTKLGIKKYFITKIWGKPPMIDKIKENYNNYLSQFDYSQYDIILVPHKHDAHIEHRFVGNILLKNLLKKSGYKPTLKIMRYELWSPILEPNYYEDITEYINVKKDLIDFYKSRSRSYYFERISGLNKYRSLSSFFLNPEKYVEAFRVESVYEYLGIRNYAKIFSSILLIKTYI